MLKKWLAGLWERITTVPGTRRPLEKIPDHEVEGELRNAAQRFSSSSRLVGMRAAHEVRKTKEVLECLNRTRDAIAAANRAAQLARRGGGNVPQK